MISTYLLNFQPSIGLPSIEHGTTAALVGKQSNSQCHLGWDTSNSDWLNSENGETGREKIVNSIKLPYYI